MTTAIYKFPLAPTDWQEVAMPRDAKILCIQTQRDTPCIWAEVRPDNLMVKRAFETFGTGHPIAWDMGTERVYVGTYQLSGGALVFHVFERP